MRTLWVFGLLLGLMLCPQRIEAKTVITARGSLEINDGDTVRKNSMWEGQITGLKDVTFIGWNFARKTPHTEVFVNCLNLTFIDCNLVNVELQSDFIIDGSLIMHKREYEMLGVKYEEIEYRDGKTKTFEVIEVEHEKVSQVEILDAPTFPAVCSELKKDGCELIDGSGFKDTSGEEWKYIDNKNRMININNAEIIIEERLEIRTIGDTTNEKKIKVKYVNPNTRVITDLNSD